MSIRHPKPKQIRLPFNVPRPGASSAQARLCGICRAKESRYVCPRCNVPYCSLDCFRNEDHAQCSEPFYKSTIIEDIRGDPAVGAEERKGMLEVLRRFEDPESTGGLGGDGLAWGPGPGAGETVTDEDGTDELARALEGVDIDSIDTNDLFKLLPQQHRDAFLAVLREPASAETRQLLDLATKAEGGPGVLPWWEGAALDDGLEHAEKAAARKTAPRPEMIPEGVTQGIAPPPGAGRKLVWNAVAMCLAYVHLLLSYRLPSMDPTFLGQQGVTADELKTDLAALVPFLVDPKSTVRYESVRQAWTAVWENLQAMMLTAPSSETRGTLPNSAVLHLLIPVPKLLHPPITTAPPPLLLAISDLYSLYSAKPGGPVARKLAFYAVALRHMQRSEWLAVKREMEKEVERLRGEVGEDEEEDEAPETTRLDGEEHRAQVRPALQIVDTV